MQKYRIYLIIRSMEEIDLFKFCFNNYKDTFKDYYHNGKIGNIYKIINDKDDKCYIGSTFTDIEQRLSYHIENY